MVVGIVAARVMAYPFAVSVNVRSFRVAFLVGIVALFFRRSPMLYRRGMWS